jgi:hypothetical protein
MYIPCSGGIQRMEMNLFNNLADSCFNTLLHWDPSMGEHVQSVHLVLGLHLEQELVYII